MNSLAEIFAKGGFTEHPDRTGTEIPSAVVLQMPLYWPILLGDGKTWRVVECCIPVDKTDSWATCKHHFQHFRSEGDAWLWIADLLGSEPTGAGNGCMYFKPAVTQCNKSAVTVRNSEPVTPCNGKCLCGCNAVTEEGQSYASNACRQRAYRQRRKEVT